MDGNSDPDRAKKKKGGGRDFGVVFLFPFFKL